VFSTHDPPNPQGARFLAMLHTGRDEQPVLVSGVVLGKVTRNGKPLYQIEIASAQTNPRPLGTATATRDPEQASPGEHFTGSPEPDDTAVFAMLSRSAKRALSRADRMRRDMKHDRVHIEHLVAGMEQDPESTATAALRAAAVDQAKLRELIHDAIGATPPPLPRPPMVPTRRPRPQLRRLSPLRSPGFARTAYPIRMTCWTSSTTWPPCAR
jgi:hypothetical protein